MKSILHTVTYRIVRKGRRWFEAVSPDREFRALIEINAASKDFRVGVVYTFTATSERKRGIGGAIMRLYPVTKAREAEILADIDAISRRGEIDKLLSRIEGHARKGFIHNGAVDKLADLGVVPSRHASEYPVECAKLCMLIDMADTKRLQNEIKRSLRTIKNSIGRLWHRHSEERVLDAIGKLSDKGLDTSRFNAKLDNLKREFEKRFVYMSTAAGEEPREDEMPAGQGPGL